MNTNLETSHEPSRNQFGLSGIFLLMTAVCLILAAISWAGIRQPTHLFGALAIVVFCVCLIGLIEIARSMTTERDSPQRFRSGRDFDGVNFDGVNASNAPQSPFAGESPFTGGNPFRDDAAPAAADDEAKESG